MDEGAIVATRGQYETNKRTRLHFLWGNNPEVCVTNSYCSNTLFTALCVISLLT